MRYPLGDEARLLSKWGCKTEPSEEGSPKVEVELHGSKKEKKDAMLRARREEARALCERGLADPYTHLSAYLGFFPLLRWLRDAIIPCAKG